MPKQRPRPNALRLTSDHRQDASSVQRLARPLGLGQVEKRRVNIDTDNRLGGGLPWLHHAWPVHEKRHADAALVIVALVTPERCHVRRRAVAAVVGEKENHRVVSLAKLLELGNDFADPLVHRLNHRRHRRVLVQLARALGLVLGDDFPLGLNRRVHGIVRQVRAPRFRFAAFDELDRPVREHVGEVLAVRPKVTPKTGQLGVIHLNIEPLLPRCCAEVPLAKHACAIAGLLQRLRPRDDVRPERPRPGDVLQPTMLG